MLLAKKEFGKVMEKISKRLLQYIKDEFQDSTPFQISYFMVF